jgi:predicted nucleotidyltransferase
MNDSSSDDSGGFEYALGPLFGGGRCSSLPRFPLSVDFLYIVGKRNLMHAFSEESKRIVEKLKQEHSIRKGSCLEAVLESVGKNIPPAYMKDYIPYDDIYLDTKKWSRLTVRKNIRRLESLGVLRRAYAPEVMEREGGYLRKNRERIKKALGIDIVRKGYVTMKVFIPKSLEDAPLRQDEVLIAELYCVNENKRPHIGENEIILEKIDMRGKSMEERAMIGGYALTHKTTRFGGGAKQYKHISHEERVNDVKEIAARCRQFSHIIKAYLVGSMALDVDNERSDTDIVIVRKRCPGYKKCGNILKESGRTIELWCCTEGKYREAEQKQFLILSGAKPLYAK